MSDEIQDSIEESATENVKSVTSDGLTVQGHSLPEQIAAHKHLKANDGVAKPHRGLRFTRLLPPAGG